jgi:hypothetical protein
MAKTKAQSEIERSDSAEVDRGDDEQSAREPGAEQGAAESEPRGTTAGAPGAPKMPTTRRRAKVITGAALAGGGALAAVRRRRRGRAQEAARRRRSPIAAMRKRTARKREPTGMELLRRRLWRR